MKKTFPLRQPGNADARVLEAVKNEVRKYVKRERRKKLPEGFDQWDLACKVGPDQATAAIKTVDEIYPALDAVAQTESPQAYVEVLATPGKRTFLTVPAVVAPSAIVPAADTTPPDGAPPAGAAS